MKSIYKYGRILFVISLLVIIIFVFLNMKTENYEQFTIPEKYLSPEYYFDDATQALHTANVETLMQSTINGETIANSANGNVKRNAVVVLNLYINIIDPLFPTYYSDLDFDPASQLLYENSTQRNIVVRNSASSKYSVEWATPILPEMGGNNSEDVHYDSISTTDLNSRIMALLKTAYDEIKLDEPNIQSYLRDKKNPSFFNETNQTIVANLLKFNNTKLALNLANEMTKYIVSYPNYFPNPISTSNENAE